MSEPRGPSINRFLSHVRRKGIIIPTKEVASASGSSNTIAENPEQGVIDRLSGALRLRFEFITAHGADPETDNDIAIIRAQVDASRKYVAAALGEEVDDLDEIRTTLQAFTPENLTPLVFECATLEEAWIKAAELSGEDPNTFPEEFGKYSSRHLLKEEALVPQSVRVEFNPVTQALTFIINFGEVASLKCGVDRNPMHNGEYHSANSINLTISAEEPQTVIDNTINFDKKYTWDELVTLLMGIFKVNQKHIEAVFGSYMDSVAKMCQSGDYKIKLRQPEGAEDYDQIAIQCGNTNFHSFAYLTAVGGEVGFGTLS